MFFAQARVACVQGIRRRLLASSAAPCAETCSAKMNARATPRKPTTSTRSMLETLTNLPVAHDFARIRAPAHHMRRSRCGGSTTRSLGEHADDVHEAVTTRPSVAGQEAKRIRTGASRDAERARWNPRARCAPYARTLGRRPARCLRNLVGPAHPTPARSAGNPGFGRQTATYARSYPRRRRRRRQTGGLVRHRRLVVLQAPRGRPGLAPPHRLGVRVGVGRVEEGLIFRRVPILAHAQRDTRLFVRIQELGAEDADR